MTDKDKPDEAGVPECGRQLRRTREKLGLTVDDVAAELRLSSFQIQALEDDDWGQLPGATYARGYVRSYARLIGLDADQLMAGASTQEIEMTSREPEIAARSAEAHEPEVEEAGGEAPADSAGSVGWWAGALLVIAVIAVGYWQYREGGSTIPDEAGRGATVAYEDTDGEEALQSVAARETGDEAAPGSGSEAAGSGPPTPVAPGAAVFQFDERSWVEVRDARGERLLYRSFPAGRRVGVEGRPPFRVYLGNARGVRVEYMGEVITPDPGTGRLYARLLLGGSSG